jgi:GAF domain-containing protein
MEEPFISSWLQAFERERARQDALDRSGAHGLQNDNDLQRIVDLTASHYGTRYAAVSVIDRRRQILLAQFGMNILETPRETAFCAITIHEPGQALIVPDAEQDPRFHDFESVRADPFVRFYAGIPLLDRDGFALGALCVADTVPLATSFDPSLLRIMGHEAERQIALVRTDP